MFTDKEVLFLARLIAKNPQGGYTRNELCHIVGMDYRTGWIYNSPMMDFLEKSGTLVIVEDNPVKRYRFDRSNAKKALKEALRMDRNFQEIAKASGYEETMDWF